MKAVEIHTETDQENLYEKNCFFDYRVGKESFTHLFIHQRKYFLFCFFGFTG